MNNHKLQWNGEILEYREAVILVFVDGKLKWMKREEFEKEHGSKSSLIPSVDNRLREE